LDCQLEKQCFTRKARSDEPANFRIVRSAMSDRLIEDRRIGSQTRNRKVLNIALKGACIEKIPCNVVQPDALPLVVERFSSFHNFTPSTFVHDQDLMLFV